MTKATRAFSVLYPPALLPSQRTRGKSQGSESTSQIPAQNSTHFFLFWRVSCTLLLHLFRLASNDFLLHTFTKTRGGDAKVTGAQFALNWAQFTSTGNQLVGFKSVHAGDFRYENGQITFRL